jgi:hypothetical protein
VLQNAAAQPVGQRDRVEVDQQADLAPAQAKIGEKLRFVKWGNALDRLDLQDDRSAYDDIGAVAAFVFDAVVVHRQGHLAFVGDAAAVQFMAQASLVDGFEQSEAKALVDAHREADDPVGEVVIMDEAGMRSGKMGKPR